MQGRSVATSTWRDLRLPTTQPHLMPLATVFAGDTVCTPRLQHGADGGATGFGLRMLAQAKKVGAVGHRRGAWWWWRRESHD
jgi:hypothetical protein